ncbi:hypothetical protein [Duganella sp. LjRoot269]|uniref:hypothetical protein n=1 Tax=Duganella sp. LjRoot269 TaxID=3342305 RepID=UPI003ECF540E
MLSHSKYALSKAEASAEFALEKQRRADAQWRRIEHMLTHSKACTSKEIADALGVSVKSATNRLNDLRELGEVCYGAPRDGSTIRTWSLGAEDFAARAEHMRPTIVKAQQMGIQNRDPLMAFLFGAADGRFASRVGG